MILLDVNSPAMMINASRNARDMSRIGVVLNTVSLGLSVSESNFALCRWNQETIHSNE